MIPVILKLLNQYYHKKDHLYIQTPMEDKHYYSSYDSDLFLQLQLYNCIQQLRATKMETFYMNSMLEFDP